MVVLRGTTRIFRAGAADFPCGRARIFHADRHKSSVRIRFENGGNQKANFVRNNAKESRNTPQARNLLIVRADICGFSARSSAEKLSFPCHVRYII